MAQSCNRVLFALLIALVIVVLIGWAVRSQSGIRKTADEIADELEDIEQRAEQQVARLVRGVEGGVREVVSDVESGVEMGVQKTGNVLGDLGRFIGDAVGRVKDVFYGDSKESFTHSDGTPVESYTVEMVEKAVKDGKVYMVVVDETNEKFHNSYHGYHPYPSLFQDLYLWYPYRAHRRHRKFFRSRRPCQSRGRWVRFAGDWIYVTY